jgi:hypothetical protein
MLAVAADATRKHKSKRAGSIRWDESWPFVSDDSGNQKTGSLNPVCCIGKQLKVDEHRFNSIEHNFERSCLTMSLGSVAWRRN